MFAAASWREFAYFRILKLPETSTIYDFMLLTLRLKDLIATFNWDRSCSERSCETIAMLLRCLNSRSFMGV
jgi:hypothetical protein